VPEAATAFSNSSSEVVFYIPYLYKAANLDLY